MKRLFFFFLFGLNFFFSAGTVSAFDYHVSWMGNYDITRGLFKGQDYTVILAQNLGVRYSEINNFTFIDKESTLSSRGGVYRYKVEGDYKMPMLLKMLDFKTFDGKRKGPFDFLTGYMGIGYANLKMDISKQSFSASGSQMVRTDQKETVKAPVYAASFGFYGGEKYVVVDTRIRYFKGKIDDSDLIDKTIKFDDWAIIFSIGLGF